MFSPRIELADTPIAVQGANSSAVPAEIFSHKWRETLETYLLSGNQTNLSEFFDSTGKTLQALKKNKPNHSIDLTAWTDEKYFCSLYENLVSHDHEVKSAFWAL